MAIFQDKGLLSNVRDLILPGVWQTTSIAQRNGVPIIDADVSVNYACDEIQLGVRYRLLTRRDLDGRDWKQELGPRLQAAMRLFHRMPAAKALCVDRRRLNARGEKARKETNRPVVRKAVKRKYA